MKLIAKAELIIDHNDMITISDNMQIEDIELGEIELDRRIVLNIREKAAMLIRLIDNSSDIDYSYPPRTKHEINGGYKIAKRKGALLHEVKVYNLYFRFRSWYDGTGIAMMCRPPKLKEEWIILLPDNTEHTIMSERKLYLDIARRYTLLEQIMDPDEQNRLIHNLNKLNIHERCAQSIMHEFGHILHWRVFDNLQIRESYEIYNWFYESGYLEIVDKRIPHLKRLEPMDQLYILKESLVEDYRISLNNDTENGIFILPNKICYSGDFQKPELLLEGVDIMRQMLRSIGHQSTKGSTHHLEMNAIHAARIIEKARKGARWTPGTISITEQDVKHNIENLRNNSESQVASSLAD
ncbi:MAG: hypothetical protein WDZ91_03380 [Paenibacillaceae bacterium]